MADPTREQAKLIKSAKRFSKKVSPLLEKSADIIEQARSLFSAFASAGYHALLIPQKFGGMGLDYKSAGLVYETLSHGLPGTLHGPITSAPCSAMIQNASAFFQLDIIYVGIICIGLIALAMDLLLRALTRRMVAWQDRIA